MSTQEIPRSEWITFFDEFSRAHEGWLVTMEIMGPEIGAQIEARQLPLEGLGADPKDRQSSLSVAFRAGPLADITHRVLNPSHVRLLETPGEGSTLQIEAADGTVTILHVQAAERPETGGPPAADETHPTVRATRYGLRVPVSIPYDRAVERTTEALKAEGFGVLTTIDVRATLKKKLDRAFRPYVILGACNPPLADKALQTDLEVGLLLPCNVVVYEDAPGTSVVAAMAPTSLMGTMGSGNALGEVAQEAEVRLRRALEAIARG